MIRRIIQIDEEKCNGCGACAKACHEGAISMVNGKAKLMRDDYCDGLGDCLPNCPVDAIHFVEREAAAYDAEAVKQNMLKKQQEEATKQPINSIEVESILRKVSESLTARRTLQQVQTIFQTQQNFVQPQGFINDTVEKPYIIRLKGILQKLGITGERGSKDIISLVDYLIQHNQKVDNVTLSELCSRFSDNPKSMEQRIRRTANMGMVNLANLGLEDYANDTFTTYSNSLYNFEQVRREMDFIRGKSVRHGNVKIKNFLNALIQECTERA